jgi:hypothetical protein
MLVEASESQPETTRPAKPSKPYLSLVKGEQEGVVVFTLESFKDSIKDNISV